MWAKCKSLQFEKTKILGREEELDHGRRGIPPGDSEITLNNDNVGKNGKITSRSLISFLSPVKRAWGGGGIYESYQCGPYLVTQEGALQPSVVTQEAFGSHRKVLLNQKIVPRMVGGEHFVPISSPAQC